MSEHSAQALEQDEFARLMAPFFETSLGRRPAGIAVAVSGGADSVALAVLAAAWGRAYDVCVTALSVDHGLRAESRAEADQVGRWLSHFGVDHHILTWRDGARVRSGVQARARQARYDLMEGWCRSSSVGWLLTAHHQDDQAETFVMRLKRGSTLFGLAAMAPLRRLPPAGEVMLCRPFLDVPKARLVATLQARAQAWIEDPSNTQRKFERVRVRQMLIRLREEGVSAERLAGAARAARRVTDILERGVTAFEAASVRRGAPGTLLLDARAFAALPEPLQVRAMSRFLQRLGARAYGPRQVKMRRLLDWLSRPCATAPKARTLAGCVIERAADEVRIRKEAPRRRGEMLRSRLI